MPSRGGIYLVTLRPSVAQTPPAYQVQQARRDSSFFILAAMGMAEFDGDEALIVELEGVGRGTGSLRALRSAHLPPGSWAKPNSPIHASPFTVRLYTL